MFASMAALSRRRLYRAPTQLVMPNNTTLFDVAMDVASFVAGAAIARFILDLSEADRLLDQSLQLMD